MKDSKFLYSLNLNRMHSSDTISTAFYKEELIKIAEDLISCYSSSDLYWEYDEESFTWYQYKFSQGSLASPLQKLEITKSILEVS